MIEIYLHNNKVNNVFQLLGEHENDISYSVAWALSQSPSFLSSFIKICFNQEFKLDDITIRIQSYEKDGGITDIEIESPNEFYIIIEAKKGWNLPGKNQLEKYSKRLAFTEHKSKLKILVIMSECSSEYAKANLQYQNIGSIKIIPISWKELSKYASESIYSGSHKEKHLLNELKKYLGGLMSMQNIDSNWVYVVSLNNGTPEGWGISWIDIVEKQLKYFHPLGINGWPKEPPNYIAFRYSGKLQSIHRIEKYEVITNLHKRFPEIPSHEEPPLFVYSLGPAFAPQHEVKTGKLYANGRVRCMIDTLFTSATIKEARDISQNR